MTEDSFQPNYAIPPGATLRDELRARHMTQSQLAQRMGRPKKTISEIVNGKAEITAETALQLETVLGVPARFWLALEANYQEDLARIRDRARLQREVQWARQFPVRKMAQLGWIKGQQDDAETVREVLAFFGVASADAWHDISLGSAAFLASPAYGCDQYALSAWLRQGELGAEKMHCQPFRPETFRRALAEVRTHVCEHPGAFVPRVQAICAAAGVAVVLVPELPGVRVRGSARWLSSTKAMILLSLRHKTDDHLWFAFYHEAAHLLLHAKDDHFVDLVSDRPDDLIVEQDEQAANTFAAEQLIPQSQLDDYLQSDWRSRESISAFARRIGVTPGIVVGRLQHDGHLPWDNFNYLKLRLDWANPKE
jgi:addiction module HigA family antidote